MKKQDWSTVSQELLEGQNLHRLFHLMTDFGRPGKILAEVNSKIGTQLTIAELEVLMNTVIMQLPPTVLNLVLIKELYEKQYGE